MTTSERIRLRRKELGLSADQVAASLGVSRATLYRYESAEIEKIPSFILEPLARILLTTPAYLMGWDEPSAPSGQDHHFANMLERLCAAWDRPPQRVERDLSIPHDRMHQLRSAAVQPTGEELDRFAAYFSVPRALLEPRRPEPPAFSANDGNVIPLAQPSAVKSIPVLGKVPAGVPIEAVQDIIEHIDITEKMARSGYDYFGLLVTGNSMVPEYLDGDVVIVRMQPTAETGDDVVAYINGYDATLKRITVTENGIQLRPLNPEYETRSFTNQEVAKLPVTIAGVVVELRRKKSR